MEKNYFKLLNEKIESEKNGKDFPFEKEKRLVTYRIQISDHFRWKQKNKFIETIKAFLENKIDVNQYIDKLYQIDNHIDQSKNQLESDLSQLIDFEPNENSKGFSQLIENLFSDIRILEPNDELRTSDEISLDELVQGIKEFLPKIEKY